MDRQRIIALLILYRRYRKRKRKRLHWVHPINQKREAVGTFHTLFEDLRSDDEKFINYFRMSKASFDELHGRLKASLQRQNTKMRNCIEPLQMLAVTLRYLGSGCTFTELHHTFRIGVSTASRIVRDVCLGIWKNLSNECIPSSTKEKWLSISEEFEKKANFPHCLGAVDGKHIRLTNPTHGSSVHKECSSVVLMAVADTNYHFVYADIGSYGKDCDSTIFKQSSLWKSLENNSLQLPDEKSLPGMERPEVPYFFIGDEAFASHKHLVRPYGGSNLTTKKRIFNYRLCRARRYVECTFGIFTNKWKLFHRPINVYPDFATDIIKACVVLHNFILDRDGYDIEDTLMITGFVDLQGAQSVRGGVHANNLRNILADYFMMEAGAVKWQITRI